MHGVRSMPPGIGCDGDGDGLSGGDVLTVPSKTIAHTIQPHNCTVVVSDHFLYCA